MAPRPLILLMAAAALPAGCREAANPGPTSAPGQPAATTQASSRPTSQAAPRILSETEKIEALIQYIESMDDALFIRNNAHHGAREAAKHLRDKWNWKMAEIHTARDFIRIAATKSSFSGKPYRIRFKDGREVNCGKFLLEQLKRIERAATPNATQPASHPATQSSGEASSPADRG